MAESIVQPLGPLAQVSPAAVMVPVAAGGNKFQEDLMNSILANNKQKQDYIQQQQLAYENEMRQYSQQVAASRDPDSSANKAGLWGSIAAGAAQLPNTWGNMGAMIGNMGAAAGQFAQGKQQRDIENLKALTNSREANLRSAQSAAPQSAVARALGQQQGKWIQYKDDAGNTYTMNNVTGEKHVVPATRTKVWNDLLAAGLRKAIAEDEPDKQAAALSYAISMFKMLPGSVTTDDTIQRDTVPIKAPTQSTQVAPSQHDAFPKVSPAEQVARDQRADQIKAAEDADPEADVKLADILSKEDLRSVQALFKRIQTNPATAPNDSTTIEAILAKYPQIAKRSNEVPSDGAPPATGTTPIAEAKARAAGAAEAAKLRAQADGIAAVESQKGLGQRQGDVIPGAPVKLSPGQEKELFEADDLVRSAKRAESILNEALKLNDTAYSGYLSKARATLRSNLPGESAGADATVDLDNMMTSQALESLKATFGGMPTEGERKILLEMQASTDKTPKQRKSIIDRAILAAQSRAAYNAKKANALRTGVYNYPEYSDETAATQPGDQPKPEPSGVVEWVRDPETGKLRRK